MENKYFDSHAHLLDERFADDIEGVVEGMGGIICVYSPEENINRFKELLKKSFIWGIAGIHPHDAKKADTWWNKLEKILTLEKVVAVGEIGLDFYYNHSPRDRQIEIFVKQIEIALQNDLPVVIHTRNAFKETIGILKEYEMKRVLIHCFPGDLTQMGDCIERGYHIAVGGVVTFPKAEKLTKVVKEVPVEKLLLETDCPYLAPQPVRGRRNQPSFLKYTAQKIADIKKIQLEDVAEKTFVNSVRFFGL